MKTSDLIDLLVRNLRPEASLNHAVVHAAAAGTLIAGIAFFSMIGFRADIDTALTSIRFLSKLLVTLALAISSALALPKTGKPGVPMGSTKLILLLPPVIVVAAALCELSVTPADAWITDAIGRNSLKCLTVIPLLSLAPLACLLQALRRAAPEKPGMAGMIAGLAAAGISATFYAANCDDDSPLFVILWYPIAIGIVALIGYLLGNRLLRW